MRIAPLAVAVALAVGCGDNSSTFERVSLSPYPNPFGPSDPLWAPQPHRDRPLELVASADGATIYVALQGLVDEPGSHIAAVDATSGELTARIAVGSSPTGLALHPSGRYLVVTNRFSNFASVIDTARDTVVAEIEVPFYTIDVAFTPDGDRAYMTNRWKDSVLRWDVDVTDGFHVTGDNYSHVDADRPMGIPVGQNPRDLAIGPDGERLYVAGLTGLSLSIIDIAGGADTELRRVDLMSPPGDVVVAGAWIVVTHTGRGTHHPPDEGYDTDGDGTPGDGTANVMFQDLQNEIAVFDRDGVPAANYTSDSMCCHDYRDVDPDDPTRGEALPAPDTWPRTRVDYLPARDSWVVACALPQQMAVAGDRLIVVCSGSNEVQTFDIDASGTLSPRETAGELFTTGMSPYGVALSPDGSRAFVAERLGEHVTVLDLEAGPGAEARWLVGDESGGAFPATDAELGEAINFVTAGFTVDGDQTCVHCHREGGNLAKPVAMPLQGNTVWGTRMQMAYRGAADTRPWFIESSMDETNFFPVINEFARKENFCCEQLDPLVWSTYPSAGECVADPQLAGCNHVLDCRDDPPPECAARGYGAEAPARNEHFMAAADALFDRRDTFGDALYQELIGENGELERVGIALDFNGVTRAIGLFLLQRPRLLPNPNAALDLASARRGEQIFTSPATGCAFCHPQPTTAVSDGANPYSVAMRFPAVVTPRRHPDTLEEVDGVNPLFLETFPDTVQDDGRLHIGVPQLRGIWDRATRFLHDGRAPSLLEAIAPPGHPALADGQVGFNESYGMPDTHGATSHLSPDQLEDLVAFMRSL